MPDFYHDLAGMPGRTALADDGVICYVDHLLAESDAAQLSKHLATNIQWHHQLYYGKPALRGTAWFADDGVIYRYSGQELRGEGWTDSAINAIRRKVQSVVNIQFNSVLMHRYPDGAAQMGWHADAEPELGDNPVIASVSFGAARKFNLRRNSNHQEEHTYTLKNNSLLVMAGKLQHYWKHCVPKQGRMTGERFNLTFRFVIT